MHPTNSYPDRCLVGNSRNRNMALVCAAALGVLITAVLAADRARREQSVPEVVRAQRFVLTDASGQVRAELAVVNGFARLRVGRPDGQAAWVGVTPTGEPRIGLTDARGRPYVELGGNTQDGVFIHLYDPPGETVRLTMEVTESDKLKRKECTLAAFDEKGRVRAVWGLNAHGVGSLTFMDPEGRIRAQFLGPDEKQSGSIRFVERKGNTIWRQP